VSVKVAVRDEGIDNVSKTDKAQSAYYRVEVYKPPEIENVPDDDQNDPPKVSTSEGAVKLEGAIAVMPEEPGHPVTMYVQAESEMAAVAKVRAFLTANGMDEYEVAAFPCKLYVDQEGAILSNYLSWEVKESEQGIKVRVQEQAYTVDEGIDAARTALQEIAEQYEGMPDEADAMMEQFLTEYCEDNGQEISDYSVVNESFLSSSIPPTYDYIGVWDSRVQRNDKLDYRVVNESFWPRKAYQAMTT